MSIHSAGIVRRADGHTDRQCQNCYTHHIRDIPIDQEILLYHTWKIMFWFILQLQIDRLIPVAGKEELTNFTHLFWKKTRRNMTDGHIWFSVLNRPTRSRFTRVQRLTCCLSLLFCSMMASILFYGAADNMKTEVSFAFTLILHPLFFYIHSCPSHS